MRKRKQAQINYDRLSTSIVKENMPNEEIVRLLVADVKRVLDSYFIYQNEDFRYLINSNQTNKEFVITLKYRRIKDVKIL